MSDELKFLQDIALFGGLNPDALTLILDVAPAVSVSAGSYFFRESDEARSMFVLRTGQAAVLKAWRGEDYVLRRLEPKDCFGEMALMDLEPRSASVLAVSSCTALELSGSTLDQIYKAQPEQFTILQMNMGREVSRRLRESNQQLFESEVQARAVDGNLHVFST